MRNISEAAPKYCLDNFNIDLKRVLGPQERVSSPPGAIEKSNLGGNFDTEATTESSSTFLTTITII